MYVLCTICIHGLLLKNIYIYLHHYLLFAVPWYPLCCCDKANVPAVKLINYSYLVLYCRLHAWDDDSDLGEDGNVLKKSDLWKEKYNE